MERQETQADHLYGELRRMAGAFMRRERPGHTLQPTALANEAFLSVGPPSSGWQNKAHYFGAAANAMRRVLIQHSRARRAQKRGGNAQRVPIETLQVASPISPGEAYRINEALEALAEHEPTLANLVALRYFEGYTLDEISGITGRSLAALKRDWNYARAWLLEYMTR